MAKSSSKTNIQVAERLSQDLALRMNANSLFDEIKDANVDNITLDFSRVHSMSRSFAHQYLKNREKTKKKINEKNITENVKTMLEIAKIPKPIPKPIDTSKAPTISI